MNEKVIIGGSIGVGIAILLVVVFVLTGNSSSTNSQVGGISNQVDTNSLSPEAKARYIEYTDDNLASAIEKGQKPVIFFHAKWCVYCRAAENDILSNFDQVPKNVTILRADYDTTPTLKSKYGVVVQDTFVQVGENGDVVAIWISGGRGVAGLLANVI